MTMRNTLTVQLLPFTLNNMKIKLLYLILITLMSIAPSIVSNAQTPNVTTSDGTLRKIQVPILMYHYVGSLPPDADEFRINLTISTELFRSHVEYLDQNGFSTISLYEISDALLNGTPLPEKPIILTFDDGHLDHYTNVFPILNEYSFTGTFFIITQFADVNQPGYLSWDQIKEMADVGMSMQSHTKTHPDLRDRDHDFLVYQILGSIESLEHYTEQDITAFSYPAGRYDPEVLELLDSTQIRAAVTTQFGMVHTNTNMLEMTRLRIANETGVAGLDYLLSSP